MTESAAIRIDFTPCRGVPFYPHDTGTIRLMHPAKGTQGGTRDDLSQMLSNQLSGAVSAETPRVHARIPPGQPHSRSTHPITPHQHTHTTSEREQRVGDTQVAGLPAHKTACG